MCEPLARGVAGRCNRTRPRWRQGLRPRERVRPRAGTAGLATASSARSRTPGARADGEFVRSIRSPTRPRGPSCPIRVRARARTEGFDERLPDRAGQHRRDRTSDHFRRPRRCRGPGEAPRSGRGRRAGHAVRMRRRARRRARGPARTARRSDSAASRDPRTGHACRDRRRGNRLRARSDPCTRRAEPCYRPIRRELESPPTRRPRRSRTPTRDTHRKGRCPGRISPLSSSPRLSWPAPSSLLSSSQRSSWRATSSQRPSWWPSSRDRAHAGRRATRKPARR